MRNNERLEDDDDTQKKNVLLGNSSKSIGIEIVISKTDIPLSDTQLVTNMPHILFQIDFVDNFINKMDFINKITFYLVNFFCSRLANF